MSQPESQVHRDPLVEELVGELRDRVAFLERSLERRSVEAERYQQIVAGFTQTNNQLASRLRALETPQEPPGSPESAVEPERESPGPVLEVFRRAMGGLKTPPSFRCAGGSLTRPWWRRVLLG